jgi:hypothetical protein
MKALENIIMIDVDDSLYSTIYSAIPIQHLYLIPKYKKNFNYPEWFGLQRAKILLYNLSTCRSDATYFLKYVQWHLPNINSVAIIENREEIGIEDLIMMGFKGCIIKSGIDINLNNAITKISSGGYYFPDELLVSKS